MTVYRAASTLAEDSLRVKVDCLVYGSDLWVLDPGLLWGGHQLIQKEP